MSLWIDSLNTEHVVEYEIKEIVDCRDHVIVFAYINLPDEEDNYPKQKLMWTEAVQVPVTTRIQDRVDGKEAVERAWKQWLGRMGVEPQEKYT